MTPTVDGFPHTPSVDASPATRLILDVHKRQTIVSAQKQGQAPATASRVSSALN